MVVGELDDAEFARRVVSGIRCMGRVDHDGLTELAADGSRRRLGRIGWAEDVAGFADGIDALVDDGDAFFRAGLVSQFGWAFGGFTSCHELHDLFPVLATVDGAEDLSELFFSFAGEREAELFLNKSSCDLT